MDLSASHFICVTNIGSGKYDVTVYETFGGFRNPKTILTPEGRQLIRLLTGKKNGEKIKGKTANVALQEESGKS